MTRLRRAMDATCGGADDGVAMLTAILMMMIVMALSVTMLGVVTAQVKPTMFAGKNQRTVSAAETGLDAALSQMRSALAGPDLSGKIYGDPTQLPCTAQGTVGSSSTLTYQVTLSYFDKDPSGKDATWRAANQFPCSQPGGVKVAPSFAVLSSQGLDAGVPGLASAAGDRTVETIYTFQLSSNNINGGTIWAFGNKHCLQATGQTVGAKVTYVDAAQCGADDPRQLWTYAKDYGLHLSVSDLTSIPLCITGNSDTGGNIDVTLQKCTTGNTSQMFSWEGGAIWKGQRADNTNYANNLCLGSGGTWSDTDLVGKTLKYGTCIGGNTTWGSYDPDPRVCAGAASKVTVQIVNFHEFGRCMDVTGENVTTGFMIDYPCKQDPSGGGWLNWNHKWSYSEPTGLVGSYPNQEITVKNGGSSGVSGATYCLKTPSATASPAYVTMVTPCSGADDQRWTRNAKLSTYAASWTFTDKYGRCISLGDKLDGAWSKLIAVPCTGGNEQKWNAPPVSQDAKLTDLKELKD